jgi:ABC-type uncharacterized transport system substrate-binding protein
MVLLPRGLWRRQGLLKICLAVALLNGAAIPVAAHPHVWATVRSEIIFGPDQRIIGIRHAWTFDEFYTAMAIEGLDTNNDGIYAKEELAPLAKVNVESLKEFDYFTFVRRGADEKLLPLKEPVDYWVEYDKTVLTLHFTLPLESPLDMKAQEVEVDVYDPTYFVAFGFAADAPVKIAGSPAPSCAAEVKKLDPESEAEDKALSEAFFSQLGPKSNFGSQFAQTMTVKC